MIRKFKGTEEGPGKSPSLSPLIPSILPPTTIASFLPLAALALYFYESGSEEERMRILNYLDASDLLSWTSFHNHCHAARGV